MPERISKIAHEYGGRHLTVGELFDADAKDIRLLLLLGRIEPEQGEPGFETRDLFAGEPAPVRPRDAQRKKHDVKNTVAKNPDQSAPSGHQCDVLRP